MAVATLITSVVKQIRSPKDWALEFMFLSICKPQDFFFFESDLSSVEAWPHAHVGLIHFCICSFWPLMPVSPCLLSVCTKLSPSDRSPCRPSKEMLLLDAPKPQELIYMQVYNLCHIHLIGIHLVVFKPTWFSKIIRKCILHALNDIPNCLLRVHPTIVVHVCRAAPTVVVFLDQLEPA